MEKRKPFGDITNLSLSGPGSGGFTPSSPNLKPRTENHPTEPSGQNKQLSYFQSSDEKMADFDFTVTKPRKPDQIETRTEVSSSSKVVKLLFQLFLTKNQSLLQG